MVMTMFKFYFCVTFQIQAFLDLKSRHFFREILLHGMFNADMASINIFSKLSDLHIALVDHSSDYHTLAR